MYIFCEGAIHRIKFCAWGPLYEAFPQALSLSFQMLIKIPVLKVKVLMHHIELCSLKVPQGLIHSAPASLAHVTLFCALSRSWIIRQHQPGCQACCGCKRSRCSRRIQEQVAILFCHQPGKRHVLRCGPDVVAAKNPFSSSQKALQP